MDSKTSIWLFIKSILVLSWHWWPSNVCKSFSIVSCTRPCTSAFFCLPFATLHVLLTDFSPLNLGKKWHLSLFAGLASYHCRKMQLKSAVSFYTSWSSSLCQLAQCILRQVIQVVVMPAYAVRMEMFNQLLLAALLIAGLSLLYGGVLLGTKIL